VSLQQYRAKRDFRKTPEPGPGRERGHRQPIFVVQEHHASRLHYDFRLEADGVLKSWAVPKEPSMDPAQKRLAVRVEDHPLSYASFEGTIPEGEYGAGTVSVWDHGTYSYLLAEKGPPRTVTQGIDEGRVEVALHGEKLRGKFALVRMRGRGRKENWLLIKMRDEFARRGEPGDGRAARVKPSRPRGGRRAGTATRVAAGSPGDVEVTHPDKVWFPEPGITKGEVFDYYRRVAPLLLPYLRDRPVTLERLPEGLTPGGPRFWQKNTPPSYPACLPRAELPSETGKTVRYALVNDLASLLYLVNQGTITFHVWSSRVEDPDRPDFVLFDLDRGEAPLAQAVAVARALHDRLVVEGVEAAVKTSGKTGLHLLTPWHGGDFDKARRWALQVARQVAEEMPEQATVEIRKAKRGGRVYIDVLQNARGHHAVAPYVVRAVPAASVSMPLRWQDLDDRLDPARYNVRSVPQLLARRRRDPMAELLGGAAATASR
jgi:bifunctional non-homologous end joining protein LigD